MNSRKFSTWIILCLTILTAELLVEVITHWASHYTKTPNPYKATAIAMTVAVLVFYPAFHLMDELVKKTAQKYVSKTKQVAGGGMIGLLVAFLVGLVLLYSFYLKVKFGINLLDKLF